MEKYKKPAFFKKSKGHAYHFGVAWARNGFQLPWVLFLYLGKTEFCWIPFNFDWRLERSYVDRQIASGNVDFNKCKQKHYS